MPFSSGTFTRTFDCTTDRDNGVKILASKFDTEFDGIATGLSTCILKDGTQTCTAAIPFAEGLTIPDNKTIVLGTNSDITIQYDETTNDALEIAANVEGAALGVVLKADQGDDNADQHKLNIADGGVLTLQSKISGGFVTYLTHTPNATVADSTTAVAGNLTVAGDLTLGSGAVINEAELEAIDGITAGTVAASKAVIVDSNKDIGSFRNVTLTGELDAGSLDISGDADIDGTLEADAMTLNGTAITATATLDTGISNNNVPKFTSGVADDDFLRVDGTAIEGRSASEVLSDIGAAPAAGDSNIVTTGALNSGSITSGFGAIDNGSSNITTTGVGTFGSLDISGDIDVDGTTNLDVVDIDGAVDMASTLQVDGAITSSAGATITTADNTAQLTLKSTDADSSVGPVLDLVRDSASPADGDAIGQIKHTADNDAGEATTYASSFVTLRDATDGVEDGQIIQYVMSSGALVDHLRMGKSSAGGQSEVVVNEGSVDIDFRVEGNGNANALFVQGSDDFIGIGTGTPKKKLHIQDTTSDGIIILDRNGTSQDHQICFAHNYQSGGQSGGNYYAIGVDDSENTLVFAFDANSQASLAADAKLILDSDGTFTVRTTPAAGVNGVNLRASDGNGGRVNISSSSTGGYHVMKFFNANGEVGSIGTSGTSTSFNTSSDQRLKENVVNMTGAIDRLKALTPKRFNFIADADTTVDGFLAHEAQTVVPEAVTGTKDETREVNNAVLSADGRLIGEDVTKAKWTAGKLATEEGGKTIPAIYPSDSTWSAKHTEPVMQGIDQAKLVPLLTGALQEAIAEIETLKTKVAALEAGS